MFDQFLHHSLQSWPWRNSPGSRGQWETPQRPTWPPLLPHSFLLAPHIHYLLGVQLFPHLPHTAHWSLTEPEVIFSWSHVWVCFVVHLSPLCWVRQCLLGPKTLSTTTWKLNLPVRTPMDSGVLCGCLEVDLEDLPGCWPVPNSCSATEHRR